MDAYLINITFVSVPGTNLTVRPPYEDLTVYKHIENNVVVHAYGLAKHTLENHCKWIRVPTVLTLGLSKEMDDLDKIFGANTNKVEDADARIYPTTSKQITALTFTSRINVIDFFENGDQTLKPPLEWKQMFSRIDDRSNEYRSFKQSYSYLCLTYIYAMKCIQNNEIFSENKKERQRLGSEWKVKHEMNNPKLNVIDLALVIHNATKITK